MANKFANILAALGLNSNTDSVTEAHLQAADDKIALLEKQKTDAETRANAVQGALDTANASLEAKTADLTKVQGELTTATGKVATLEEWKKQNKATDGRSEDESNKLDAQQEGPKAAWEVASDAAIASAKKRVGEK
jgi:peptidoglycan hydrolase CwlO-like protein